MRAAKLIAVAAFFCTCVLVLLLHRPPGSVTPVVYAASQGDSHLDSQLADVLSAAGFTGNIEQTFHNRLEANLGRPIDQKLANLGRLLWFDKIHSLHHDNTCGGCHSPTNGFGDSQPMAIGVQNNNLVGPNRAGPRNQRRSPLVVNTALYPALMWNGRFNSLAGDPFDNALGFRFPFPEDDTRFSLANDVANHVTQLLQAQAHMPPTELIEVAGFNGTCPNGAPDPALGAAFCQFDDGKGEIVPLPDSTGSRNEPIRQKALTILNASPAYRQLFGEVFPEVAAGAPIDFFMFGKAIAEFEFTLVFANAPIDQFARGDSFAMTAAEKRGALLFFGKANCVQCHAVAGRSSVGEPNEMFTDFEERVIGVPQIAPLFGVGKDNVVFDGPGQNEDFGLEQISGNEADRYKFRTAPLRNLAVAPGFFHNGAFIRLEDAIQHHLNVYQSAHSYNPVKAGLPADLAQRVGPIEPVLRRLDPLLRLPTTLTPSEFDDLVSFVRDGLLDPRAKAENLCKLVPPAVPSGLPVLQFQACQ
ncbi:MAG TPA: cytochrome c peroxidase [Candidatus Acidoferrum sp.]|nr:cytochrome c peroxidase [Candidatus Acidoferrum sp.]